MTSSHPTAAPCQWFTRLAEVLDRRSAPRLALLLLGAVLARGRRTITSWIWGAKFGDQYQSCYLAVAAAGKQADHIAWRLFVEVVRPLLTGATRLTLALDDTPTKRYGSHVQGAGVHHNPTPGPAGSSFVFGHVLVVLGLLIRHKAWGTIALPLLSRLYIRKNDLPTIAEKHRPAFRTKLDMAVELLRRVQPWLALLKLPIWVVADGAYATKEVIKPAKALGMIVVSRLRKDAALWSLPKPKPPGRRGPAPTYGKDVIDLAKRAGQRWGWSTGTFELYGGGGGQEVQDVSGDVEAGRRVDPGGHGGRTDGWWAFFCTDPSASVADILGLVADRFALEITFREVKQVVGAGQQQVRFLWSNIGAFHICLWTYTMTEAWAWGREDKELVDRSASPWDSSSRRPSHADKRRAWRREMLGEDIRATLRPGVTEAEIRATADRLLSLAA